TTECARVHRKGPTHRPGNPGEELGRSKSPLDALFRELCAGNAGAAANALIVDAHAFIEGAMCSAHRTAHAAVADEQVAAEPDPQHGRTCLETAQEYGEICDIEGIEEQVRRGAH